MYEFALARLNKDGSLDTTFGTGGIVITPISGNSWIDAIALDSSGRIVVAGGAQFGTEFVVARYTSSGVLDSSFGTGGSGFTITSFAGGSVVTQAVGIDGSGNIIVGGGFTPTGGQSEFALARYTSSGVLDTTFGPNQNGEVTTVTGYSSAITSLVVESNGRIVAAGWGSGDVTMVGYTTSGVPDTSFGSNGNGIVQTPLLNNSSAGRRIALSPDGHIIALGMSYNQSGYQVFALCRYSASGILDTTFGTGGNDIVYTTFGSANSDPWGLAIEPDGRIVTGGRYAGGIGGGDFALARFTVNGAPDPSFGTNGLLTTDFNGGDDYLYGIAISPDSSIVAAGYSVSGGIAAFALARYGERLYVQQDANWNVTSLMDQNGTVKERFVYDPYGSRTVLSPSWGTTTDAYGILYGFQDGRADPMTGNVKFGIRDYRPPLGRWLQQDLGYIGGANLYQGMDSNPVRSVDPTGTTAYYANPDHGDGTFYLGPFGPTWHDGAARFYYVKQEWRYTTPFGFFRDLVLESSEFIWGDPIPGIFSSDQCSDDGLLRLMDSDPNLSGFLKQNLSDLVRKTTISQILDRYKDFEQNEFLSEVGLTLVGGVVSVRSAVGDAEQATGGTYVLRDPKTREVMYVGRTGNLARREAEHAHDNPDLNFEVDKRTCDYAAQRGREQIIYDRYKPPLNKIRPIRPTNPRLAKYLEAGKQLGK